jgi:multidrug transporter EmrE-like cation transporter
MMGGGSGAVQAGEVESTAVVEAPGRAAPRRGWFFNPYVQIGVGAVLVTGSELLLKKGASVAPGASWTGLNALASGWTWCGIVTYVASFASWLYVLRFVPLGVAFALINGVHVLVPVGCWLFLGEAVSARRWAGIGLVLLGIVLIARDAARAEEKL